MMPLQVFLADLYYLFDVGRIPAVSVGLHEPQATQQGCTTCFPYTVYTHCLLQGFSSCTARSCRCMVIGRDHWMCQCPFRIAMASDVHVCLE